MQCSKIPIPTVLSTSVLATPLRQVGRNSALFKAIVNPVVAITLMLGFQCLYFIVPIGLPVLVLSSIKEPKYRLPAVAGVARCLLPSPPF